MGVLVFLEFILYFKFTIDAKLSCSLCLGGCGLFIPLFIHSMNKMGWAIKVVNQESDDLSSDHTPTLEDLTARFRIYSHSNRENVLAFDRDEFLAFSMKGRIHVTSVQQTVLGKIFDAYVEAELEKLAFTEPETKMCCGRSRDTLTSRNTVDQ